MKRRLLAALLVLAMLFSNTAVVYATEQNPAAVTGQTQEVITACYVNPLYADVLTEADLRQPSEDDVFLAEDDAPIYDTIDAAGAVLRAGMIARQETIIVRYRDANLTQAGLREIADAAFVHTGNPKEGDSLLFQYGGWGASGKGSGGVWTLTYTLTYYTTAEEEAQLDAALEEVLAELDVVNAAEYTKVSAVYAYITANVTYDYSDTTSKHKYTAYGAMVDHTAVCQGYAVLLYRMLLELGIDVRVISGDTNGDGESDHAWNILRIGALYYSADSTWDAGWTTYTYFLKPEGGSFDTRHVRDEKYQTEAFAEAYPMATNVFSACTTHSWGEPTLKWPENGGDDVSDSPEATFTCTVCGATVTVTTWMDLSMENDATCSQDGNGTMRLDAWIDEADFEAGEDPDWSQEIPVVVPSSGHVGSSYTDNRDGTHRFTCLDCGEEFSVPHELVDGVCALCGATVHTHSYSDTVTKPTCTEKGYTTHTCSCGDTYTDNETAVLGHSYSGSITTAATCTKAGVKTFTCSRCNDSYTEPIPATGHHYTDTVTKPTCTEKGYTTHTCSCGASYIDSETAVLGHSYSGKVTTAATCTKAGVKTFTCSRCNDSYTEPIPATGHRYTDTVTKPTCTEKGYTTHTCSCGASYTDSETEATGHSFGAWETVASSSCTGAGSKKRICSTCGFTDTADVDANGHSWNTEFTIDVAATCTTAGSKSIHCANCEAVKDSTVIKALGHSYSGSITTATTCTKAGEKTYTCSRCTHSYTEPIPATGHQYADTVIKPTCTEKGYTTHTCSCGASYTDSETAVLGHSYSGKVTTAATCTKAGEKTYTCRRCSHSYTKEIPATGHQYTDTVIKPTCTEKGYTTHTCSCGASYTDSETAALGHSYDRGVITKQPTCTEAGVKTFTCSRCQDSYTEEIPATGHQYTDTVTKPTCTEKGYTTHTCSCGASYTDNETAALGHSYDEGVITRQPTCTEKGIKTFTCATCKESYTEEIAAKGHTVVANEAVAATCTTDGKTAGSHCSVCNETLEEQKTVPATGHSFTNYIYNNDAQIGKDGTETATCDHGCGATDTRIKTGSALVDPNPQNPFTDVAPNQYYYQPVLWAVENGITSGTSNSSFSPEQICTRAQVVTFLWRAAGKPKPTNNNNPFTDVKSNQYYYDAVLWAVEQGITSGTSKTTFAPNDPCTRAQVVTFQWRAAGKPAPTTTVNPFKDVSSKQYYYDAVLWAGEAGITQGTSKTEFSPDKTCTRGQIVTFLYRQYN